MKLIVQIPCLNEEDTLPRTLAAIPRQIPGVDVVEILVVDDGSTDRTVEVAYAHGADHVLRNKKNIGLARSFRRGLDTCLKLGADVIVNTDGDNQYDGADIPKLVAPILAGDAEVVIGDRQTGTIAHFSATKRLLQRIGSRVVQQLSGVAIPDVVSGFRALSRDAAMRMNIISPFSYTTEMIIQAGKKHMAVVSVPVRTNSQTRESRLFRSIPQFIERSATTMLRMYAMYQPLRVFCTLGVVLLAMGCIPILRFLYFHITGDSGGYVQSLVIGGVLVVIGFVTLTLGLIADLISFNRQLVEMTLEKVRLIEVDHRRSAWPSNQLDPVAVSKTYDGQEVYPPPSISARYVGDHALPRERSAATERPDGPQAMRPRASAVQQG